MTVEYALLIGIMGAVFIFLLSDVRRALLAPHFQRRFIVPKPRKIP